MLGTRSAQDAAVWRLLPTGALDTGFGSNGLVRVDLGGAEGEEVTGFAERPDGRIVAAVRIAHPRPFDNSDLAALGLLSDGALDPAFGERGITPVTDPSDTSGLFLTPGAVALEPGAGRPPTPASGRWTPSWHGWTRPVPASCA